MPRLVLTRRARNDLDRLPHETQDAVLHALVRLQAEPLGAGKPLRGRLAGVWVAKVGRYRILYTVGDQPASLVIVRAILHRGVAYRRR